MTMNWERKRSWPNRGIIPAFTWSGGGGFGKNRETAQSGKPIRQPRFEPDIPEQNSKTSSLYQPT